MQPLNLHQKACCCCFELRGCHVYAQTAITADSCRHCRGAAHGNAISALAALHMLYCTCTGCQCGIQPVPMQPGLGCCTKLICLRWQQVATGRGQQPKAEGRLHTLHCWQCLVPCPTWALHRPQTCCCPALGRLSRRLSSTDTLQGALQAALRALQFLVLPQVPAQQRRQLHILHYRPVLAARICACLLQVAAKRRAGQAARATGGPPQAAAPAAPQHEARYGRRAEGTGRRKTYEDREDGRTAGGLA